IRGSGGLVNGNAASFLGIADSWKEISMELSSSSPSPLPLQEPASPNALAQGSKSAALKERRATPKWKRAIQRNPSGDLFLPPALLIFALFVLYSGVSGFLMIFQSWDLVIPSR